MVLEPMRKVDVRLSLQPYLHDTVREEQIGVLGEDWDTFFR